MMEWYCRIEEEEITEMFIIVRAQRAQRLPPENKNNDNATNKGDERHHYIECESA